MASIIGKRIKIKKDRPKDKPLVFQPKDPRRLKEASGIAEDVMEYLPILQRETAPSRWMRDCVDDLLDAPLVKGMNLTKSRQKLFLKKWAGLIGDAQYLQSKKEIKEQSKEKAIQEVQALKDDLHPLPKLFRAYCKDFAETGVLPKFPGYSAHIDQETKLPDEMLTKLLSELLDTGSLMTQNGGKEPKAIYADYRQGFDPEAVKTLSDKVIAIQAPIQYADLWQAYFRVKGVERIEEIDVTHVKGYPAWRQNRRDYGQSGKKIGQVMINKEINFLKNVYRFGFYKKLVPADLMRDVKISVSTADKLPTIQAKPVTLAELEAIIRKIIHRWKTYPEHTPKLSRDKQALKLNVFSVLVCLTTGCRPKELNQYVESEGKIHFMGGKTKNARRRISLTPTLTRLVRDPIMAGNRGSRVAHRLTQWMDRVGFPEVNIYRLRHSRASILLKAGEESIQDIAYSMGHHSGDFLQRQYGNMTPYLEADVKQFWKWLNEESWKLLDDSLDHGQLRQAQA